MNSQINMTQSLTQMGGTDAQKHICARHTNRETKLAASFKIYSVQRALQNEDTNTHKVALSH